MTVTETELLEAALAAVNAEIHATHLRTERDDLIRAAIADGHSQASIARLLGLTTARLTQIAAGRR